MDGWIRPVEICENSRGLWLKHFTSSACFKYGKLFVVENIWWFDKEKDNGDHLGCLRYIPGATRWRSG